MDSSPCPAAEDGPHEREPAKGVRDAGTEATDLWQRALDMLRHQISADSFAGLLGDARLVEATEDTWTIGVRPHAVQWLSNRPYPIIKRTIAGLAGREISLTYVPEERTAAKMGPAVTPPRPSTDPTAPA